MTNDGNEKSFKPPLRVPDIVIWWWQESVSQLPPSSFRITQIKKKILSLENQSTGQIFRHLTDFIWTQKHLDRSDIYLSEK